MSSERTGPALDKLDALLAALKASPAAGALDGVIADTEALRRAVAAFHMEAIRFRMYSVERDLKGHPEAVEIRRLFEEAQRAVEAAGFHTRSHSAP